MADAPQKLGKYRISGVLGEGAMGVVYRGFDPDIRRLVALKTIRRDGSDVAGAAARFRNEAQAAGRLQHPGIVSVYDFGDDGRVAYIAMEFVEGRTLAQLLAQQQRLSDVDIASIGTQLLEALQHAHEHGVWHRDIKPSNVILTPEGQAKITDFGIARLRDASLTATGSVLGTPMYMAPEQFTGTGVDHRVDVYATGVLLYQLVAGRAPFVGAPEVLGYRIVNEQVAPPSTLDGANPGGQFDAVIATAMAKDPQRRFADARTFRLALAGAFGQPVAARISAETQLALAAAQAYAATERLPTGLMTAPASGSIATGSSGVPPAEHFSTETMARVTSELARHVGPLAGVMVRRTARVALDLPELYERLAEQITDAAARDAFIGVASKSGLTSTGGTGMPSSMGTTILPAEEDAPAGPEVDAQWLAQAQKALTLRLGPIARVMLRRATERTTQRAAMIELLVLQTPEDQRDGLRAELSRLP